MNKKMLLVVGLFAAATFTSCTNEQDEFSMSNDTLKITAEMGTSSRTALEDDDKTINWYEGDQFYLFDADGTSNSTVTLVDGAGTTKGTFSGKVNGLLSRIDMALYPVPTVNGDEYSYEFPADRTWSENSAAPMIGEFVNNNVCFDNLMALVRIPLTNLDGSKENTLTLNMKGQAISGIANVDFEEKALSFEGNGNQVTVTIPAGVTECNVDFPIPVGTYTGYTLSFNGVVMADEDLGTSEGTVNENAVIVLDMMKGTEVEPDDADANNYQISTAAQLIWFAEQVNTGNSFEGKTITLIDNIDLSGINWEPIGTSGNFYGTFDGNGMTISNLKVDVEGKAAAGLFASSRGIIKNVTLVNVNITGNYKAGAIVGDGLCSKIENCHVNGGTIISTPYNNDDANNVGGIVGYLSAEPTAYVKECSVTGLTITAYRDLGGIVGTANIATVEVSGNSVSQTALIADQTVEYVESKPANAGEIVGRNLGNADLSTNTIGEAVTIEVKINNAESMIAALENGEDVTLYASLKIDPAKMSNAYGKTGINIKQGQTIDGNFHTIDIKGAGGTWDSGINTTGGLIKNITVTGSFRGIFINHNSTHSEPVVLENVIIEGTVYTISCDQGMNQTLFATNSTFKGWTSYAATLGAATFTECYFGEGSGYAYCRPYAPTTFVNCDFEAGFEMDPRAAVTFENCRLDGVTLTEENISTLVTSNIGNVTEVK